MTQVPLRNHHNVGPPADDEIPSFGGGQQQPQPLPNPFVFDPRVPAANPPPLAALQEPLPSEEEEEDEDAIPPVSQPARLVSDPNFSLFLLGIAHSSFPSHDNNKDKQEAGAGGGTGTLNRLSMLRGQDGPVKSIHDFAAKLPLHALFADQLKGRYHCSNCRIINPNHSKVCFLCNQDQDLPPQGAPGARRPTVFWFGPNQVVL